MKGLFRKYGPLKGRGKGWLLSVSPEDRRAFGRIGWCQANLSYDNWPAIGGRSRAGTARRDRNGRFLPNVTEAPLCPACGMPYDFLPFREDETSELGVDNCEWILAATCECAAKGGPI